VNPLDDDLLRWDRVILIETRGRRSGRTRRTTIGFVETPDGSLLVAAGSEQTHWALNLVAEPRCVVERQGLRREHDAAQLDGRDRLAAVAALIARYGTPAERLGAGPAFRLVPVGLPGAT
jgi:deazaflavin-dependent oxidoreductase (nitroreductase family)